MLKRFCKNYLYVVCLLADKFNKQNVASILMYHSVGDNDLFFTVKEPDFEKQLKYLKKKNFNCLTLSELLDKREKKESLKNCVALTFDDGYLDNYEIVFPLLKNIKFQ